MFTNFSIGFATFLQLVLIPLNKCHLVVDWYGKDLRGELVSLFGLGCGSPLGAVLDLWRRFVILPVIQYCLLSDL